ncbi:unknown [Beak and feather disease virus]|uniref:Uncharacterized protein ORF6 n=1 Tax=Beak and feather disease virus TaxID=77856 RepID=ORF6_BFDV|nr:RecName: Full=Uncharacterized protein ORF6 [Beak and feather disease virus]AAC69866.1 unknown [Beak and feather disease virus]
MKTSPRLSVIDGVGEEVRPDLFQLVHVVPPNTCEPPEQWLRVTVLLVPGLGGLIARDNYPLAGKLHKSALDWHFMWITVAEAEHLAIR